MNLAVLSMHIDPLFSHTLITFEMVCVEHIYVVE